MAVEADFAGAQAALQAEFGGLFERSGESA